MWEYMQKKCAIFSQISTANAPMVYLFELFLSVKAMPITDKLRISVNVTDKYKINQKIKSG